jgi:hypothetical protein
MVAYVIETMKSYNFVFEIKCKGTFYNLQFGQTNPAQKILDISLCIFYNNPTMRKKVLENEGKRQ